MSDESLAAIASLQHLRQLDLMYGDCRFTLDAVKRLLRGPSRRKLTHLQLWCCNKFSREVLRQEADAVTQSTGRRLSGFSYKRESFDRHWILLIDFE